jgi:hypothetical protein
LRHDTGYQSEVREVNQTQFKLYLEINNGKVTAGTRSYVSLSQRFARHLGLDLEGPEGLLRSSTIAATIKA